MSVTGRLYLVVALLLLVDPAAVMAESSSELKSPFVGLPIPQILERNATFNCFSDTATTAGYYAESGPEGRLSAHLLATGLRSQRTGGGYRLSITGDDVSVVDEVLRWTDRYHVYKREPAP